MLIEKMLITLLPLVLTVTLASSRKLADDNTGHYIALMPRYIEEEHFLIHLKFLSKVKNLTVEARLKCRWYDFINNDAKKDEVTAGSVTLLYGTREGTVDLKVPYDIERFDSCRVNLRGIGSLNFKDTKTVYIQNRQKERSFIFIQTDKAVYKRGQKVQYRTFVVDKQFKPCDTELTIKIMDPRGNIIKKHENVSSIFGISGELQLSEQPLLGSWKISVTLQKSNIREDTSFKVSEYVLPTFEVSLNTKAIGTTENPQIEGTVTSKYTYGKPVKGHVTLLVTTKRYSKTMFNTAALQTEFEIDGVANFSITKQSLQKLGTVNAYSIFIVKANVTEDVTGKVMMSEDTVTFTRTQDEHATVTFLSDGRDYFKPGFKYFTFVEVTTPDDQSVMSADDQIRVNVEYFTDKQTTEPPRFHATKTPYDNKIKLISPFPDGDVIIIPDMFLPVPQNGTIKIELDIPLYARTGRIDVTFRDAKVSKQISRFRSSSKTYLNLEMETSYVEVGQQAVFSLQSNKKPRRDVAYHIVKSGKVIITQYTKIIHLHQKSTFYITLTPEMVPECTLIAYFYNDDQSEIIADAVKFSVGTVDKHFKNNVTLSFEEVSVSPGANVSLHVKADPGSHVFVLAVDKSVLLQSNTNEITGSDVIDKVHRDLKTASFDYRKLSAGSSLDIFEEAGFHVFTDTSSDFIKDYLHYDYFNVLSESLATSSTNYLNSLTEYNDIKDVRKHFPETWIWRQEYVNSSGELVLTETIPDTITDWVATGFALHKGSGLGIAPVAANVTAYQPLFVSMNLPFSIISGETAVIQALVFNYYQRDLYVTVSLKNSKDEFLPVIVNKNGQEEETTEQIQKCIKVKANDVSSAYFNIKALKIGTITLEADVVSAADRDVERRQLIVKSPGEAKEENIPLFMALENETIYEKEVQITYPLLVVPDSQRVQISVTGDIFGPSLNRIDDLIRIPRGCGEQKMLQFAPAVFAAKYLKATKRYTSRLKANIERVMEVGYQGLLKYQRHDGSFSLFEQTESEKAGSLWLTAFVLKTFAQASEFTYIDPEIIQRAVTFILKHQNNNGSFNTTGFVYYRSMQGGSVSTRTSIAAFVLAALKEVQGKDILKKSVAIELLGRAIKLASSFVKTESTRLKDEYGKAIAAYAMSQTSSDASSELLHKLNRSKNMILNDGTKHWKHAVKNIEVETAAYVLLAYAKEGNVNAAIPVLKWLIQQRSPYGGFHSTQDTVVALQGLAELASFMYTDDVNMVVKVRYGSNKRTELVLNAGNMDVLQYVDIPGDTRTLWITANGKGIALAEVSIFCNILEERHDPSFDLTVTTNGTNIYRYTIKACARWLSNEESGMVLLDIGFPSGYKPEISNSHINRHNDNRWERFSDRGFWFEDEEELYGLETNEDLRFYADTIYPSRKKTDRGPSMQEIDNERLVLYYNYLDKELTCYTVDVAREITFGRLQPASVKVYSYYNTERSARIFYMPDILKTQNICDLCGAECGCGSDSDTLPMERCNAN